MAAIAFDGETIPGRCDTIAGTMPVTALHHVQLAMPRGREDEARRFYVGVLGFQEVAKPEHLAKRGGAWFHSRGADVHLGVEDDFRPAKKAHPALLVDGLTELLDRCRNAGVAVTTDEPLPGFDRAYVADPFGNRIELLEPV
jgi:catechol 2,3-dioxygenase-like lactoylglutathione lyase family enzyme